MEQTIKNKYSLNIASKIPIFICYVSYLWLLFPTIWKEGIFGRKILIGDPFYTSRMKPTEFKSLNFTNIYLPKGSIFDGKTELISLGEMILSKLKVIFQLSLSDVYIFSSLILGIGILIYIQKIFKEFSVSGIHIIIFTIVGMFFLWGPFLPYSLERPISPQVILLIWVVYLFYYIKALKKQSYSSFILVGLIAGASLYFHYPFIFLQIQSGFFFLVILLITKKKEYKKHLIASLISWIIAAPYILWALNAKSFPEYNELLLRQALIDSRIPAAFETSIISAIVIILISFSLKIQNKNKNGDHFFLKHFISVQAFACAAVANSNLLLGKALEFSNHFEIFVKLLLILSIVIFIDSLNFFKIHKIYISKKVFIYLVTFSFFCSSIIYMANKDSNVGLDAQTTSIINWTQKNVPSTKGLLMMTDTNLSAVATVLLDSRIFFDSNIVWFNFSQKEINQRFYANSGCTIGSLKEPEYETIHAFAGIAESRKIVRVLNFLDTYNFPNFSKKLLIEELAKEMSKKQKLERLALRDFEEVRKNGCISFINSRGVNYIYTKNADIWNEDKNSEKLKLVKVLNGIYIYKIQ